MSAGFIRRYTSDPGLPTILQIEGVVIIDREPPSNLTGVGSGAVCVVAEFEDGPYTPTEVLSGVDFLSTFGGFGFVYDGVQSQNPCARSRQADSGAVEYWNGNGFIALARKTFQQLFLVRVDTSVGTESFTRLPMVAGNQDLTWSLANNDTLSVILDATADDATFTGAVAVLTSSASTYPTTFAGGESFNITIDANTPQQIGPLDVVFTSSDSTRTQVIATINAALGYTACAAVSSAQISLSGRVKGKQGRVTINSVSSGLVTTALGLAAAATAAGTGNVNNLSAVTFLEVKSIAEAGIAGLRVERDSGGTLRVVATSADRLVVTSATTDAFGFDETGFTGVVGRVDGIADVVSAAGTYPTSFAGGESITLGFDGSPAITVVFQSADQTMVQVMARINAAFGGVVPVVEAFDSDQMHLFGASNPGQVRVSSSSSGGVLTTLGLPLQAVISQGAATVQIPAGYRVQNSSGTEWVTTQTITCEVGEDGPFTVGMRPGLDNGTVGSGTANAVNVLVDAIPGLALAATNPQTLAAALSEAALDAAYAAAIDLTLSMSAVTAVTDSIVSARQSDAIRNALRTNAVNASGAIVGGLRGRRCVVSPPLGTTTPAQATSGGTQPGVGAYRAERLWYGYPGVNFNVPQIGVLGLAGGAGFTADGNIDVHYDTWCASTASQLPPEENPGQETTFQSPILSLEVGNPSVQNLSMQNYIAFKAAGIMAPRIADGATVIQSGVTSVNSLTHPSLAPASRGRFSDFIGQSLAEGALAYQKKPMTRQRRIDVYAMTLGFLVGLKNPTDPDSGRIFDFALNAKDGNPQNQIDAGAYRLIVLVKMNPDMLDIIFDMTVGTTTRIVQTQ